jgi:uncharacterized protein (DUF3084 family)
VERVAARRVGAPVPTDGVPVRLGGNVEKRLRQVREEMARLQAELRVVEEQVAYARELADDAETRAVVSQTPLADRERSDARDGLRRVRRQHEEAAARVAELLTEQDALLERLLPPTGAGRCDG